MWRRVCLWVPVCEGQTLMLFHVIGSLAGQELASCLDWLPIMLQEPDSTSLAPGL